MYFYVHQGSVHGLKFESIEEDAVTRLKYLVALTALISLSLFAVQADDYETRIRAALSDMGLQVERLRPAAELEGYYQVFTQQGVFYISSDATRLIAGKVFAVGRQPVAHV